MKKPPLLLSPILLSIIASLLIAIIAFAWTNPSDNPPSGGGALYYSGGNVGIGTMNPTQKLVVNGTTQAAIFYASTGVSTFDTSVAAGTVEASQFCLGNGINCITNWPTGGLSGSGTSNYISKFTGSTSLGNSIIYDNGTNVGIGTTNPQATLHIAGNSSYRVAMYITNQGSGDVGLAVYRQGQYKGAVFASPEQDSFVIKTGDQNGPLRLQTSYQDRVWITAGGNVGIGTAAPSQKLDVEGYVQAYGYYTGEIIEDNLLPEDKSEQFKKGEVLSLGSLPSTFTKSKSAYDSKIIGIATFNAQNEARPVILGTFEVLVSTENGEIKIGDLLTSASSTPGVAMKATKPGRVIGIALEPYNSEGIGKIMIFVNPHWYLGSLVDDDSLANSQLDQFTSAIKKSLEKLGLLIENGIVKVKKIIAEKITAITGKFKNLEVENKIQLKDQATGEIYCTWIENGEWKKIKGECGLPTSDVSKLEATTN